MTATNAIVVTTINSPTRAVRDFAKMPQHALVVVGDLKTPAAWQCDGATFLPVDAQSRSFGALSSGLPFNHYGRKMIGYLHAIAQGATVIVDTDDDNLPKEGWHFPAFDGEFDTVQGGQGFVNAYALFTEQRIWPRGLPLDSILRAGRPAMAGRSRCRVGVWQGLADEDPDVDAIYRLVIGRPCTFDERDPVVLGPGTLSPWNSQNTAVRRELFPLLYLPVTVTFRFTDILRGLVAQPIMALAGYQLGFLPATVVQERNPHDFMADFESELPMYTNCRRVVELVEASVSASQSLPRNLEAAYEALAQRGIVAPHELTTLRAWLDELGGLGCGGAGPRGTGT